MPLRTAILVSGRIVSAATTLLVLALVGRLRGDAELGAVGIGLAIGAIAASVSDLGAVSLLVREASRQPERAGQLLGGLALFRVPVLLATVLGVWGLAVAIDERLAGTITLVAAGIVVQSLAELTRGVFMAKQRFVIGVAHFMIENLVWLAVVALLLVLRPDLPSAPIFAVGLAVLIASALAGFGLVLAVAHVSIGLPSRAEVRTLARQAPPFAAFAVLGIAYTRIDTVIVGVLIPGGVVAAGSYFAATRVIAAFEYVPEAAARGAYPELARRFTSDPLHVAPLLGQVARGLLLIGAAIPAVLVPTGDRVLPVLFNTPPQTGWVLAALSIAVPIRYLGYIYGVALTSGDAQGKRVAAAAGALALVVAINLIAIPFVGLAAPVSSAIAAAATVGGLYAIFVRRQFGSTGIDPAVALGIVGAAAIGALAGLGVRLLVPDPLGAPLAGLLALGTYALLAALGPGRGAFGAGVRLRSPFG